MKNHKLPYGLTVQPLVVVVGTLSEPQQFFVVANENKFIVNTFLESIDLCFKLHMAMNVDYNFEAIHLWEFIQNYIYKIHKDSDKKFKAVLNLASQLKYGKV